MRALTLSLSLCALIFALVAVGLQSRIATHGMKCPGTVPVGPHSKPRVYTHSNYERRASDQS
jgi:hypothetical protein